MNFKRGPSVLNNIYSETFRKRIALTFRKTLGVYNYKVKPASYYKNPHAVDLKTKEQLKAVKSESASRKIRAYERLSNTPYGTFSKRGVFKLDPNRIPIYNIPDTSKTELKPYVAYKNAKLPDEIIQKKEQRLDKQLIEQIKSDILASTANEEDLNKLARQIFESEKGKQLIDEFMKMRMKNKVKV